MYCANTYCHFLNNKIHNMLIENFFYYQERYYDGFHCIKYIKDDLKQMKEYNEIYNRFTQYFDD